MAKTKDPNHALVERFHNTRVTPVLIHLCWIGVQGNTTGFTDILDDMLNTSNQARRLKETFPGIENDLVDLEGWDGEALAQALIETNRVGFLAEIHCPEASDFTWKADGTHGRFAVGGAVSHVEYCYGATMDELVAAIEATANACFERDVQRAKKKQTN